jgi:hypothetical protein
MRNVVVNLSLAVGVSLVILVFAELMLRVFSPLYLAGNVNWYQYDEILGVRLREGLHSFYMTDHQQEMKTNRIGTVNFQESFADYEVLVFAIGDSYTQGTGLASDASYPAQLDLRLNLRNGKYEKHFGVVNLGLAAYGLEQEILSVERYRKLLGNPTYILFLGCDNDFDDDNLFLAGYRHKHLVRGNPNYGKWLGVLQWAGELELGQRAKWIIDQLRRSKISNLSADRNSSKPHLSVATLQEERLNRLLKMAKLTNARLIVSWADVQQNEKGGSYETLREWARINNVEFVDWYSPVASVEKNLGWPLLNNHSGGHYRGWVNGIIADTFARAMAKAE